MYYVRVIWSVLFIHFLLKLYDLFVRVLLRPTYWSNTLCFALLTFCVKVSLITLLHESGDQDLFWFPRILFLFFSSPFSFPTLFNFHHVKAQGMVPFTCSIFVSSAPCRLFLSDFDVTPSSLYTCYYLLKVDNWISFLRVNKVLLYCTVFAGRS